MYIFMAPTPVLWRRVLTSPRRRGWNVSRLFHDYVCDDRVLRYNKEDEYCYDSRERQLQLSDPTVKQAFFESAICHAVVLSNPVLTIPVDRSAQQDTHRDVQHNQCTQ